MGGSTADDMQCASDDEAQGQFVGMLVLAFVMFGIACSVDVPLLLNTWRKLSYAVAVALACQMVFLPCLGLALCIAFKLDEIDAIGLLLIACAPGGVYSNLTTYFTGGDVGLSLLMTILTNAVALVTMPTTLWLTTGSYARLGPMDGQVKAHVPLMRVAVSLLVSLVPAGLGLLASAKSPTWAARGQRVGGLLGMAVILYSVVNTTMREGIGAFYCRATLVAVLLQPLGSVAGYLLSWLAQLAHQQRWTVAVETSVQNVPLILSVVMASFQGVLPCSQVERLILFPSAYGFATVLIWTLIMLTVQFMGIIAPRMFGDEPALADELDENDALEGRYYERPSSQPLFSLTSGSTRSEDPEHAIATASGPGSGPKAATGAAGSSRSATAYGEGEANEFVDSVSD